MIEHLGMWSIVGVTVVASTLSACSSSAVEKKKTERIVSAATEHCLNMGGKTIRYQSLRGEYATCQFHDGTEQEEWRFYRQSFPQLY